LRLSVPPRKAGVQSLASASTALALLDSAFEAVIQFRIPPLRPFARRSRESGNPGISVACPPVHARGRLWVPAFAGTTNCPSAGFPDSLESGDDDIALGIAHLIAGQTLAPIVFELADPDPQNH